MKWKSIGHVIFSFFVAAALALTVVTQASAAVDRITVETSFLVENQCTGQSAVIPGRLTLQGQMNWDSAGGLHINGILTIHAQGDGLVVNDVQPSHVAITSGGAINQEFVASVQVVSTGAGQNWVAHTTGGFTLSSNGTISNTRGQVNITCQG